MSEAPRILVGYAWGGDRYCLEHVPDPDLGEALTLGELPPDRDLRCITCGESLRSRTDKRWNRWGGERR